jgi:ferredoxin-type protein NapH
MKRQAKRKAALYTALVLFPVTFYYLSPILIIMSASEGIVNGSFLFFTFLFFSSLFLGRAFCGWACPAGGLQEACFKLRDKGVKGGKYDYAKYLIWIPWLTIIITMVVQAGGYSRVDPLYQTWHGISVSSLQSLVLLLFFSGIIAAVALSVGRRAFCHYGCWMAPFMIVGRKIRNLFRWISLHLEAVVFGLHGSGIKLLENNTERLSQQKAVTILGVLYPIWMVFGILGITYVPSTLIVSDDP